MNKKISINLYIADHHFPLTVTSEEEEVLRKAAKLLNEKIESSQQQVQYSGFGKEKLIVLAALTVVTELIDKNNISGKDIIESNLEDIRIMLEDSILDN